MGAWLFEGRCFVMVARGVCVCVWGGAYLPVSSSLEKSEAVGCKIRKLSHILSNFNTGLALTMLVSGVLLALCTSMFTSCTCCRSMVGMGLQQANIP